MMQLLIILLISAIVQASPLELNYSSKHFESFTLSYCVDKNNSLRAEDVLNMQLGNIDNIHGQSGESSPIWYKISFNNSTEIEQKLFLHNDFAYYSKEIDIFELAGSKLLDKNRYDILADASSTPLTGSSLIYELKIPAKTERTVLIKNTPMVSNMFNLKIYDYKSSQKALIQNSFSYIFIIAIMFTLAFYNTTLFFFNKRKEFLLYALYLITPAIGLLYKYGIFFSYFSLYGESTYWFNLTAIFMPAFLIIFVKEVLHTKSMHKRIDYMLNTILFIITLNIASAFFINLTFAMEFFKLMFLLVTISLIYLIVYLFKHSHPLATIFAFAYAAYFTGLLITILAMSGLIAMTSFTFESGGIGIIIEALVFSYLMHHNVKLLEQRIREQKETIITKNKKEQLGDMIGAIVHQWKQPLSRITSITSLLSFKLSNNNTITDDELHTKISQIDNNIKFLNNTINDFKDFFNPNLEVDNCDIAKIINNAIKISQDDTLSKEVIINTDLHFEKKIDIYKNELLHIILNILQNSKDAFKNSQEKIKIIKIIGYNKEDRLYIDIIDNAGGINEENLPLIFDENYTTKKDKSATGLGLYLSKVIMTEHLKGNIEATNIQGGAMFRIIL